MPILRRHNIGGNQLDNSECNPTEADHARVASGNLVNRGIRMIELAASILSADFARLAAEPHAAVEGGATVLHVEITDGHFIPNLTIGPAVVARSWSPVVLFPRRAMRGRAQGDSSNPPFSLQTEQIKEAQLQQEDESACGKNSDLNQRGV